MKKCNQEIVGAIIILAFFAVITCGSLHMIDQQAAQQVVVARNGR